MTCWACGMTADVTIELTIDWYDGDFPHTIGDEYDIHLCRGCAERLASGQNLAFTTEEPVAHIIRPDYGEAADARPGMVSLG